MCSARELPESIRSGIRNELEMFQTGFLFFYLKSETRNHGKICCRHQVHDEKLCFDSFLSLLMEKVNIQREIAIQNNKLTKFTEIYGGFFL